MPDASNAVLMYEASQTQSPMSKLADQGDHKNFKSSVNLWSQRSGWEPNVKPNGVETGGLITPASDGSNDAVDISAITAYWSGTRISVNAVVGQAITRPSTNDYLKASVTIDSGGSIAIVSGTEGASWSANRGAAGGPPWIPTQSIEVGQIWMSSQTPAPFTESEIKQVEGNSKETYNYPVWEMQHIDVENAVLGLAGVEFVAVLPTIHSDDAGVSEFPKEVFAEYSVPEFAEAVDAFDYVPPANSHTVNTTQVYGRTKGSTSKAINQGTFSIQFEDGVTDALVRFIDERLWFDFYPDRLKSPHIFSNGILGMTQNFPAGDNINADCTISAEQVSEHVAV